MFLPTRKGNYDRKYGQNGVPKFRLKRVPVPGPETLMHPGICPAAVAPRLRWRCIARDQVYR